MLYGPEYATLAPEPERCGNCRKPSDDLVLLENGWDFKACPACAEWCHAVEAAEPCPDLHRAMVTAKTIEEVRLALRAHPVAECVHCGATKKSVMEDRSLLGTRDATCRGPVPENEVA